MFVLDESQVALVAVTDSQGDGEREACQLETRPRLVLSRIPGSEAMASRLITAAGA